MAGPAPVEIARPEGLVAVDEEIQQAHQAIADSTTKAGIPTTKESVSPDPLHILTGVGEVIGAAAYSMGKDAQTAVGGEEAGTFNRATTGGKWRSRLREKFIRVRNAIKPEK